MNKYLVIEGIDGSGKSTLLEELKRIYKCDEQIEFVKSPTEPFDVLVKDIWDCPPLERFMFFVTSNLFFLNTADRQKIYILDRFIYSTYVTHVNPDNKILLSEIIRKLDLMPFVTVLLKVSKDEVVRRLKKRNNAIDNSLDIDRLYELYYNSPRLELGEVIELVNESESDLEKNVVTIAKKITKLKK